MAASTSEPPPPYRPPFIPGKASQVLQRVPSGSNPKVKKMRALRAKLDAHPHDLKVAVDLARTYVGFGRELGDAHYAGYAEAAIAPWMAKHPPPASALVMHATILQYRHKFTAARKELNSALKRNPKDAQAWLTLASVAMVQGDFDLANKACVQTATSGGNTLGIACTAALRSFTGRARQANKLLGLVQGGGHSVPAGVKAWIQGLLAETAERLGKAKDARAHFIKALSYTPNDNFLLVNYADFLLDHHQPKKVLELLAGHRQSDTAFLRLALAKQALKSPETNRYRWIMTARFAALALRGSRLYGREHSRFVLHMEHDPQRALALAKRNWQVQRAPWDVRVYLEAAAAAHKPAAAKPVLDFLKKYKLQDPHINPLQQKLEAKLREKQ